MNMSGKIFRSRTGYQRYLYKLFKP